MMGALIHVPLKSVNASLGLAGLPSETCGTGENRLVCLVYLVYLVSFVQPNKPDQPDEPAPLAMTFRLW
jgi:hypothetical protein